MAATRESPARILDNLDFRGPVFARDIGQSPPVEFERERLAPRVQIHVLPVDIKRALPGVAVAEHRRTKTRPALNFVGGEFGARKRADIDAKVDVVGIVVRAQEM